jgi:general secretion pathway protein D
LIRAYIFGLLLTLTPVLSASIDTSGDSPKELALSLARKAARAEKAGDDAEAYIYYSEASALDPHSRRYKARMESLQGRAARQAKVQPRLDAGSAAIPPPSPDDYFDTLTQRELAAARELNAVPHLTASSGQQSFDLNDEPRALFEKVAAAFGLRPVFDSDYPANKPRVHFQVSQLNYADALYALQESTNSFVVPVSSRAFMVAEETPAKRNELEQFMAITVPVPQAVTTQDLTELSQIVRQTMNVEKISWDSAQSRIIMRDRVSRVVPAVAIFQQLLSYRTEVMIDLEFIQVASTDVKNYGFNPTTAFFLIPVGNLLNYQPTIPSGVKGLLTFGGGKTVFGLSVAEAEAMFNEALAKGSVLYQAQMRSVAGQPATLHVGEKYPVITAGYYGATNTTGTVYAPPPSFTYEDLGLDMKVTPFVHGMGEVTLNLETSFQVLTGQSVNNIPVIGSRRLASTVRLRNDEWAVMGGLMSNTHGKAVNGFFGLAQIPLAGYLFREHTTDTEENTVLVALRPRLLTLPPDQILTHVLRVGSETRPYIPL